MECDDVVNWIYVIRIVSTVFHWSLDGKIIPLNGIVPLSNVCQTYKSPVDVII
jgi:hypothetical protein